jgi:hypothetical protein
MKQDEEHKVFAELAVAVGKPSQRPSLREGEPPGVNCDFAEAKPCAESFMLSC